LTISLEVHLKNVYQPNIFVGSRLQILDIFHICLRFETWIRLDLEPESNFEMTSINDDAGRASPHQFKALSQKSVG
jgi:hypothetical protein